MQKLLAIIVLALLVLNCKKPEADFTYTPESPKAGETVQFTNKSTDARSYSWNFGDMSIGSEENPVHIYENAGNYIVDLSAHNGLASDEETVTIEVKE